MAANNFFAYAPHQAAAATAYSAGVPPAGTPAYPTAQPGAIPAGVAGVPTVQPPVAGYSAAHAAQAAASAAASNYRASTAAAQAVVAYSAYGQAPQTNTPTASYAPTIPAVTAANYAASSYPQYAQHAAPAAVAAAPQMYDTSRTAVAAAAAAGYYPQPTSVAVTYSMSDPHYQARPVYSTNSNVVAARPALVGAPRQTYTASYVPSTQTTSYTYGTQGITGKPNIYVQPSPATINLTPVQVTGAKMPNAGQWNRGMKTAGQQVGPGGKPYKTRVPPKPQQLHYCEVCKISCAGPQTYKEHLEGQKHKKREAALKTGSSGPTTRGGNALRCELCDVTCTGSDAYAAHIRGAKHQKVVKLHTKLGKPIPSVDPVLVTKGDGSTELTGSAIGSVITTSGTPQIQSTKTNVRTPSIPKITFVGAGQQLKGDGKAEKAGEQEVTIPRLPEEKDVQPVGHDYIEEIKNDDGKVVSFNCKLCECRFNDPNAKEMHMKGRRHRLQYKKKVNPDLVVDVKPSLRQRKMAEERAKRTQAREEFWRRREEEFRLMEEEERAYWEERRRFEEEQIDYYEWCRGRFPAGRGQPGRFGPGFGPGPFPPMLRRPDTIDDRHVMAKHAEIYPSEEELAAVQKIVSHTEKALKLVSDSMTVPEQEKKIPVVGKKEDKEAEANGDSDDKKDNAARVLKGVMRVGVLAKGLLLKGDSEVRLVVLCGEKPTLTLLDKICGSLPQQFGVVAPEDNYKVTKVVADAGFVVSSAVKTEHQFTVHITLTSPAVREEASATATPGGDALDRNKCLDALAALRHAKWFQARAAGRQSCVMVIRILRDFCQRVPTWQPIKLFPLELLVEKVLASAGVPLSPGDALRRVYEALAGGLLLPDSPGFLDPCEKEPQDAARDLTPQQREDITASAQHALRLIAFRQIHKVMGMEALPPPKFGRARFGRKRRRDSDSGDGEADEKKDKKDEEEEGVGQENAEEAAKE